MEKMERDILMTELMNLIKLQIYEVIINYYMLIYFLVPAGIKT